ncbi:MAG: glycosyltransferase family 4 protein [Ignavibacteriaceae bacterium]|nr:glycosyltransferase family 4 protein [Ignavibacteriaceae bacterium]
MKILVLYQSPWWNAAAYYTFNLVKSLTRIGCEIIFVGKSDTPIGKRISDDQFRIADINIFEKNPINFYSNIKKVRDIIVTEEVDYLIPISAPGHIIVGLIKMFSDRKLPIIKVCLDNVRPVKNLLNIYLHNTLTDYFIFPGNSTKVNYHSFQLNNFSIIHAPIDVNAFLDFSPIEDYKTVFGIPKHKVIISFIGRFSPEKGIFFLLDIMKSALSQSDNLFFILSGSEEQVKYADVQNKITEYKIDDKVKIINKVDDVRKIISITDIGILSSRFSEYICRIAMEFMVFKTPIVAPNVNVIPEVVGSDGSGFVYQTNSSTEAASFVIKLVNNSELRNQMGENSYQRIRRYYDTTAFDNQIKNILEFVK